MIEWVYGAGRRIGKVEMVIAGRKEREYLQQLRPTLFQSEAYPYAPENPFRWAYSLIPRRGGRAASIIYYLMTRDDINYRAQKLLDRRIPLPHIPRSICKTDMRVPLERKVLTDLALRNWW